MGTRILATWLLALVVIAEARAQPKPPLRVAVMDFTPAASAPEFAPLGAGLQSMITTDLGSVPTLVLVERARLKDIQAELHLAETGQVDKQTAAKIGGLAGASHLLVGSFTVVGGKMRLDARLFAVGSGEVVLAEKIEGAQTAFFELEKSLVGKIVDSVGVKLARKQKAELGKGETQDFTAFQKYSEGLVLFDDKKPDEAIAAMQAALARDPNFTLAANKLAEFQRLAPMLRELAEKAKPPASCRPNPTWAGACQPETTPPPTPPPPLSPTVFAGETGSPMGITLHANGTDVRCVTPCQLHLPAGPVDLEVLTPVHYVKHLEVPSSPAAVTVSVKSKTNLIIGATLAAAVVAGTVASIALFDQTSSSTGIQYGEYWPLPLALATGLAFPAVYFLMRMGKNDAHVTALTGGQ
jgi:TolB-like protein